MKTKQQPQQQYRKISEQKLQAILNYLTEQPYKEVYKLIPAIQQTKKIEEEKENKQENQ